MPMKRQQADLTTWDSIRSVKAGINLRHQEPSRHSSAPSEIIPKLSTQVQLTAAYRWMPSSPTHDLIPILIILVLPRGLLGLPPLGRSFISEAAGPTGASKNFQCRTSGLCSGRHGLY